LYEMTYNALVRSATTVPADVKRAMEQALEVESNEMAKLHLRAFVENVELAAEKGCFACSDTGWPLFFVKLGDRVQVEGGYSTIYQVAREAVTQATQAFKLRPTLVHPLTRVNPGTNVGDFLPDVKIHFVPLTDNLEVIAVPKGGGSEMYGTYYKMLYAADGKQGVIQFVLDAFLESSYAGQTCPPNIIGVGIGGTMEICTAIAKQAATLRPIGSRHPDKEVADLEQELLEQINALGVGPMGMGGRTAAFDVHIELAMTHSGALPVAFVAQCAVARRAFARLGADGQIRYGGITEWEYR
jgi:tartrate/fumarate subfamily iron-sulfur-dependent hydro-lyase alpha chain